MGRRGQGDGEEEAGLMGRLVRSGLWAGAVGARTGAEGAPGPPPVI